MGARKRGHGWIFTGNTPLEYDEDVNRSTEKKRSADDSRARPAGRQTDPRYDSM